MVSVTPPSPVGIATAQPAPVTGPTFDVFVLMKTGRGRCAPFSGEDQDAVGLEDAVVAGPGQPWVRWPGMFSARGMIVLVSRPARVARARTQLSTHRRYRDPRARHDP